MLPMCENLMHHLMYCRLSVIWQVFNRHINDTHTFHSMNDKISKLNSSIIMHNPPMKNSHLCECGSESLIECGSSMERRQVEAAGKVRVSPVSHH